MLIRVLSFFTGVAVLVAMTVYLITTGSGWNSPDVILYVAVALILCGGAVVIGGLDRHKWSFGLALMLAMVLIEGYQVYVTAERTMYRNAQLKAPLEQTRQTRQRLEQQIAQLRTKAHAETSALLHHALGHDRWHPTKRMLGNIGRINIWRERIDLDPCVVDALLVKRKSRDPRIDAELEAIYFDHCSVIR